jgi:hypothetical protein
MIGLLTGYAGGMESLEAVVEQLLVGLREQLPPAGFRLDGIEVHLGAEVELSAEELASALQAALPGVEVKITLIPSLLQRPAPSVLTLKISLTTQLNRLKRAPKLGAAQ